MAEIQPVPQWAPPFLGRPDIMAQLDVRFNPVWLKWFIDLINQLASGGAVDHNSLSGLQGGNSGLNQFYHLTSAQAGLITGVQSANAVYAGPAAGAAAVAAFRALVTADLAAQLVTYAKIQNVTDARILGRSAGSAGSPMEIGISTGLSLAAGVLSSAITQYTDEMAEDAVGGILTDTASIDLTYNDGANTITADVKTSFADAGTYTPTATTISNVSAVTVFDAQWMRVKNVVTVSGLVLADPTAVGATVFDLSLPIPSNFGGSGENCGGTAASNAVAGLSIAIYGAPATDNARFEWIAVDTSNRALTFSFTYQII